MGECDKRQGCQHTWRLYKKSPESSHYLPNLLIFHSENLATKMRKEDLFDMKLQKKVSVRRSVGLELISSPEVRVSRVNSVFIPFRGFLPAFTIPLMTLNCLRLCFLVFAPSPQFLYVHDASAHLLAVPFSNYFDSFYLTHTGFARGCFMESQHLLTTH